MSAIMAFPAKAAVDDLKKKWTDKYVRVKPGREDLARFASRTGRVVTINYGGRAVVDFGDGGWYDVADFANALEIVDDGSAYDGSANSAQAKPARQG